MTVAAGRIIGAGAVTSTVLYYLPQHTPQELPAPASQQSSQQMYSWTVHWPQQCVSLHGYRQSHDQAKAESSHSANWHQSNHSQNRNYQQVTLNNSSWLVLLRNCSFHSRSCWSERRSDLARTPELAEPSRAGPTVGWAWLFVRVTGT